jgi:tetratricopeptide (TPR) repeat protein
VSLGQEFKVFAPGYTGKRKFSISDGRTVRSIGIYPRVELTTITVFNVQTEVSFAYISDVNDRTTQIEVGANLEAIPTGSISHLLTGASKYFPVEMDQLRVGDSSEVQKFVKSSASSGEKPFAVVFRFSSEQEYIKRYGSAAFNAALARLFREATSSFYLAKATGVLDGASVCIVGRPASYNEKSIIAFADKLREEMPELRLAVGIFCQADIESPPKNDNSKLDPTHAIEFARYAASDYASKGDSMVVHFGFATARRILFSLRNSKSYKQALADFEKLRTLGVESADLQNIGGLISSSLGLHQQALDLYESALKRDDSVDVYKTNFGTATYQSGEYDRGLRVLNKIPLEKFDALIEGHPYGYVTYARLLALAKIGGLASFDAERFAAIAEKALDMVGFRGSRASNVISTALASS